MPKKNKEKNSRYKIIVNKKRKKIKKKRKIEIKKI